MNGTLFVVATPIGNLEDITFRAVRVLKEVDVVACEDTRVTKKLLAHYDIHAPTISYHAYSSDARHDEIVALLRDGKHVALVTDAGTPGVSDPGAMLVSRVREACGDTVRIVPIPGASALTAALSVAGLGVSEFVFTGFVPHKKGRATLMKMIADEPRAVVMYESTHRIVKLLEELAVAVPTRHVFIAREATKMFEEYRRGNPAKLLAWYTEHPDTVRGEFVVIVTPLV